MSKRIGYFEYGQVYPPPLVDGAPPVVTEPDVEQPVTLGAPWWAIGWYIAHATILGAVFVTQRIDAQDYCTGPWQPLSAIPAAFGLWAITIIVRKRSRRRTA